MQGGDKISQLSFVFSIDEEIPLKRCTGPCGQEYPATTEYWSPNKDCKFGLQPKCRQCHKEYLKEYRSRPEVKEMKKQRMQAYNSRDDVKKRRLDRIHRSDVKEHKKEYDKKWHKEYSNREGVKERTRKRVKEHNSIPEVKERLRAYNKEYRKDYVQREDVKEKRRSNGRNRQARKKSIQGTHTPEQIQDQLKRQHHKCYYCQKRLQKAKGQYIYHVDHTFPISRVVGMDIPANDMSYLVLTCPTCNISKGDKFPWEFIEGGRLF